MAASREARPVASFITALCRGCNSAACVESPSHAAGPTSRLACGTRPAPTPRRTLAARVTRSSLTTVPVRVVSTRTWRARRVAAGRGTNRAATRSASPFCCRRLHVREVRQPGQAHLPLHPVGAGRRPQRLRVRHILRCRGADAAGPHRKCVYTTVAAHADAQRYGCRRAHVFRVVMSCGGADDMEAMVRANGGTAPAAFAAVLASVSYKDVLITSKAKLAEVRRGWLGCTRHRFVSRACPHRLVVRFFLVADACRSRARRGLR